MVFTSKPCLSPTSSQNFHISWTMWTNRTCSRWHQGPHVSSADSSLYSCDATVSASSPILRAQGGSTLADSSYIFASFNLISLILISLKFSQQLHEVTVQRSSRQTSCKTSIKISDPKLNMWNILNAVFYILSPPRISVLCSFHLSSFSSLVLLVLTGEKNTSYCQMISTLQFALQYGLG